MGVKMQLKSLLISISFLFTCPIFSQNIFIDSNQVAIFLNGSSLWSSNSHALNISGGFAIGGILDFGYQGSFISTEGQGYYEDDEEYDVHSFLISGILTKKQMQVSIDLSIGVSNANSEILTLGFSLAHKTQFKQSVEAVYNFSAGIGFRLDDFPENQEFAIAASADLLISEVFYFGPGIGYSGEELFYGLNAGFVIPFSKNINQ
jgi:hypothetical protein